MLQKYYHEMLQINAKIKIKFFLNGVEIVSKFKKYTNVDAKLR